MKRAHSPTHQSTRKRHKIIPSTLSDPSYKTVTSNDIPYTTKHMILIPKWFLEFIGSNRDLFFYYSPMLEKLQQLVNLGAFCLVLNWQNKTFDLLKKQALIPSYFKSSELESHINFDIDTVDRHQYQQAATWDHVLNLAKMHFNTIAFDKHYRLHIHDGTGYLNKADFVMTPEQLLDALLLPEKACQNISGQDNIACLPSEKAMDALLNYLSFLVDSITQQNQQEQHRKLKAFREKQAFRRAWYKAHSQWQKPKTVSCGFFCGVKRPVNERQYEPLYKEELLAERAARAKQQRQSARLQSKATTKQAKRRRASSPAIEM